MDDLYSICAKKCVYVFTYNGRCSCPVLTNVSIYGQILYNSHVSYYIQCKFIQRHRVLHADRRTHKTGETNRCIFATIR